MKAIELYDAVKRHIEANYGFLGVNKKREVIRLVFEISKIKRDYNFSFLPKFINYEQFKRELLKLRYPLSYYNYPLNRFYLGKIDLNSDEIWNDEKVEEIEVIVEEGINFGEIFSRIEKKFKIKSVRFIKRLRDYLKEINGFYYNDRKKKFYLLSEKNDFVKRCPCTSNCISCSYYVMNLGFGCPFDCEYCYLMGYQNIDGIVINTNVDDYISEIKSFLKETKKPLRIGTGEFTDSLVYDDITHYSKLIINSLRNEKYLLFEFKTKSDNIINVISQQPSDNFVISYSINPDEISSIFEHGCASYEKRLECLKMLSRAGWRVAIHFDPLILVDGWKSLYSKCVFDIFNSIDPQKISWISAGCLRFYPQTKKFIEKRFPDSDILNPEMIIDFDGKLRYPFEVRYEMYKNIIDNLKMFEFPLEKFYLCMESYEMWKKLSLRPHFIWNLK